MSGRHLATIMVSGLLGSILVPATCVGAGSGLDAFNAKVKTLVETSTRPQTGMPPQTGPAIVANKTIVIVPCAMGAEGCARMARGAEEAAAMIGWKTLLIDPAGDPSQMANAVRRAISIKADGIALAGPDAGTVLGALKEARAAGLTIVSTSGYNQDNVFQAVTPTPESFMQDGYDAAATAYQMGNGRLRALEMTDNEFGSVRSRIEGVNKFLADCEAAGGDCKLLATDNYTVADLTTRVPQQAVAIVRRNPDYDFLFAAYDAGLNFMIQGLRSAGLDTKGNGASFDANVANLDNIRNNGYQRVSVGQPMEWFGYGLIDQLNRLFAHAPLVDEGFTSKVLVKENLPASGPWIGDVDFRVSYRNAWHQQ
jgi:ribose transport system substrate-binding protein